MDRSSFSPRCARIAAKVIAFALAGGCASEVHRPIRPEYDLRDPSATRRLAAVSAVERGQDRTSVAALIELLDDDDESVRMAAGGALKNLTGYDTGYRAFEQPEVRKAHVARWRAWWRTSNGGAGALAPGPVGVAAPSNFGGSTSPGLPSSSLPDAGPRAKVVPSVGRAVYTSGASHVRTP